MNSRALRTLLVTAALLWMPRAVAAQNPAGCSGSYERLATITEQVRPGHFRLREKAEVTCDNHKFFADHVDFYTDEDRLVASGNVLLVTPDTRITATRVEFDLKAKTGVFYDASGISRVKPAVGTKSMYGTQEADMYFRGEKLEKLGEKKYRLTRGGFTTCLQPTARWEFTSGTVTINVDRYAVAKNTVFRVKGVPLLYLPIIYYPLDEDNRSTGFLLPSYGNSYIHGQTIRNAFFWAISRSTDLTLMHDWFSKTGQAVGAEFRYAAAPGSSGRVTTSLVNEKEYTILPIDGGPPVTRPAGRNYQVEGSLVQQLPGNFRAGAQIRYFTDIAVESLYNFNPFDYTSRQSTINGNVSGQIAGLQLGAAYGRTEDFYGTESSNVSGSAPRITVGRPEQTLFGLPVYWGFTADSTGILSKTIRGDTIVDRGRTRLSIVPTVRAPLSRLPWLTAAAGVSWYSTWWSRSIDASGDVVDEPVSRRYFEMNSTLTGPVFSRVFNTPGGRFAQRWKHVIEPAATISRTTAINVGTRVLTDFDSLDRAVGGVTRLNYSLANRLYIKRGEGQTGTVREIASIVVSQDYYGDAEKAAADQLARDPGLLYLPVSNFGQLRFNARVTPAEAVSIDVRADFEKITNTFRSLSAGGTARIGYADIQASWSKARQPKDSPFADNDYYNAHSLNGSMSWRNQGNSRGVTYRMLYDVRHSTFINQSLTAFINPQCCGVAIEYFRANLPTIGSVVGRVYDRRFNVTFTLAGVGTFSDFFGAFGADPYRR